QPLLALPGVAEQLGGLQHRISLVAVSRLADGSIWLDAKNGKHVYWDPGMQRFSDPLPAVPAKEPMPVNAVDANGSLWMPAPGGRLRAFRMPPGTPGSMRFNLCIDDGGAPWLVSY